MTQRRSAFAVLPLLIAAVVAVGLLAASRYAEQARRPDASRPITPYPEAAVQPSALVSPTPTPASPTAAAPSPLPMPQPTSQTTTDRTSSSSVTVNGKEINTENAPSGTYQDGTTNVTWSTTGDGSQSSSVSIHSTGSVSSSVQSSSSSSVRTETSL